ncbi:MAG: glycine oxidase ThiO [gamma proteobacterium symbiont of Bathyaustriella thionipta]|nr:glycine oxidase ThiO [gamma proteobacterium symbiont of Bathyaustriella thionipta]MCU7949513.1 glycine oxidase ThiO [gamma proteobacterium symbiont of Bathyaustriella thionipta]MCU7954148.1 glycine oxidase ThiO [gamma proteobacterium symbiont of Bathyaustriella thionipta]MCU7956099.1 glycine oxidase ThiO [gamma proteobacterium symbiont of Bathyaustriella thionipta]MCU7968463.1 glycine oxidase ThiO [gamma proteobacterium symbiont of Bathyaustriella thionipta]
MNKIIIIGAGIIGMLTARLLVKKGISVTIIEQGYAGKESSWAGGGIISPLYPWRYSDPVTRLAQWGQRHYPELLEEIRVNSGIDPEYIQSGLLYLDIEDELQQAIAWEKKHAYAFESVSGAALKTVEPGLDFSSVDTPQHGCLTSTIGQVRNPRLVRALREDLLQLGVIIEQQTQALSFITQGEQLKGVMTDKGSFYADQVVVAGGAWSARLLEQWLKAPKIAPVKGQMIVFKAKPGVVSRIVLSKGRYVIPRKDGRVVLGSTLEFNDFDKTTSEEVLQELKQEACRIIPALSDYPVEKQWAGLRPGSIDGVPYIGEHPELKNLYLNAGHFRNGVVIGLASCQLLVDQLLEQDAIVDPTPYLLTEQRLVNDSKDIDLSTAI